MNKSYYCTLFVNEWVSNYLNPLDELQYLFRPKQERHLAVFAGHIDECQLIE